MSRLVTSLTNPTVKSVRGLHLRKEREQSGLFVAEGLKIVTEAVELGHAPRILMYGKDAEGHALLKRAIQATLAARGEVIEVTQDILAKVSRRDNPQAVVAVFAQVFTPLTHLDPAAAPCFVALHRVRDPGNLGTIIRSAHAAEAGGILLGKNTVDPYSDKVLRSSMGSIFHLPLYRDGDMMLKKLQNQGYKLAVTSLDATRSIYEEDLAQNLILVIGNEGSGVTKEIQDNAEMLLKIPMPGGAESLNAAVAASVILFEKVRQTQEKSL